MRYVITFLKDTGYPGYIFIGADSEREARETFMEVHPNYKITGTYINVVDARERLLGCVL